VLVVNDEHKTPPHRQRQISKLGNSQKKELTEKILGRKREQAEAD